MMFTIFKRPPAEEGLLSMDQAKAIIEPEIERRNWGVYDMRGYSMERRKGQALWRCSGGMVGKRGGWLTVEIDAKTGELIRATAGGR